MDLSRLLVRHPFSRDCVSFIDPLDCGCAEIENDRLRHIRLHERVNDLPDPNYATLKFLMGHLDLSVAFFSCTAILPSSY